MGESLLPNEPGGEQEAVNAVAGALRQLNLPAALLEKLQTSVYNAMTRIYAAQTGGPVQLVLFTPDCALPAERAPDQARTAAPLAALEPGWGFFLIERRGLSRNGAQTAPNVIELYCYQEGR